MHKVFKIKSQAQYPLNHRTKCIFSGVLDLFSDVRLKFKHRL